MEYTATFTTTAIYKTWFEHLYIDKDLYDVDAREVCIIKANGSRINLTPTTPLYYGAYIYDRKMLIKGFEEDKYYLIKDWDITTVKGKNLRVMGKDLFQETNGEDSNGRWTRYKKVTLIQDPDQPGSLKVRKIGDPIIRYQSDPTFIGLDQGQPIYYDFLQQGTLYCFEPGEWDLDEDIIYLTYGNLLMIQRVDHRNNAIYFDLAKNLKPFVGEIVKFDNSIIDYAVRESIVTITSRQPQNLITVDVYRLKWTPEYHRFHPRSMRERIKALLSLIHRKTLIKTLPRDILYIVVGMIAM